MKQGWLDWEEDEIIQVGIGGIRVHVREKQMIHHTYIGTYDDDVRGTEK